MTKYQRVLFHFNKTNSHFKTLKFVFLVSQTRHVQTFKLFHSFNCNISAAHVHFPQRCDDFICLSFFLNVNLNKKALKTKVMVQIP